MYTIQAGFHVFCVWVFAHASCKVLQSVGYQTLETLSPRRQASVFASQGFVGGWKEARRVPEI